MTYAIWNQHVYLVRDTEGDRVELEEENGYSRVSVALNDSNLLVDPTDEQLEIIRAGGDLPRCNACGVVGCVCQDLTRVLEEWGFFSKRMQRH